MEDVRILENGDFLPLFESVRGRIVLQVKRSFSLEIYTQRCGMGFSAFPLIPTMSLTVAL